MAADPDSVLSGDALKRATRELAAEIRARMDGTQNGVGTFCDHAFLGFISQLEALDASRPWEESVAHLGASVQALASALQRIQSMSARRHDGRFVDYVQRRSTPNGSHGVSDLGYLDIVSSQGVNGCMQWKGLPLFKTAYDCSIYSMLLWALQPRTILELGSGTGASAVWLADVSGAFGMHPEIYSIDIRPPDLRDDRIHFVQGDSRLPQSMIDERVLADAPHPWLVIEDAHVKVPGVLFHLHRHVRAGDYVVVEDSAGKQDDVATFLESVPGAYKVDTYYTDFFGRNVTCAEDSILVRVSGND